MKLMRQLLKDRVSASAIAFLISCFLLLQGVVGAVAQGAMAAAAVDPLNVICTSMGATVDVNSDDRSGVFARRSLEGHDHTGRRAKRAAARKR